MGRDAELDSLEPLFCLVSSCVLWSWYLQETGLYASWRKLPLKGEKVEGSVSFPAALNFRIHGKMCNYSVMSTNANKY